MQAAIRAGYKPDSAQANASRLMDQDGVREAIDAGMALLVKKTGITAERVLEQMGRLAFSDLRKAFDVDGRLKPPGEWDDDTAAAMAGIDVVTVSKGQGEVEYVAKIRMTDKRAALADIARVLGMNKDGLALTGKDGGPVAVENVTVYRIPDNGR
jgi:phage terminase small subunit